MSNEYFSGQGEIALSARDPNTGLPTGVPLFIGDANAFDIKTSNNKIEVKENISGKRQVAVQIPSGSAMTGSINFRRVDPVNAALMMWGMKSTISSGSVVAELAPNPVAIGSRIVLARPGLITSPVIVDSAVTPLTLVLGTDFVSDGYGVITFLTIPGTQPYKVSYSVASVDKVAANTQDPPIRYLFFMGKNTAERGADNKFRRVQLRAKKVQFDYVDTFPFIQENDVAAFTCNFSVLKDEFTIESDTDSAFYNIYYID